MEIYIVKKVYEIELIQNKKKIHKKKTYIKRDIQKKNIDEEETYAE